MAGAKGTCVLIDRVADTKCAANDTPRTGQWSTVDDIRSRCGLHGSLVIGWANGIGSVDGGSVEVVSDSDPR